MKTDSAIAAKKVRLDALRPLAADSLRALDRWYDVELTYTSTAIEGSTLTRSETAIVVEKGITIGGKPLRDHLEALDHMAALVHIRELAGNGSPIREMDVRQIHRLVLLRSGPEEAGAYSFVQAIRRSASGRRSAPRISTRCSAGRRARARRPGRAS